MEFRCFTDIADLPSGADALFARCEQGSLFLSRPWFENLVANALEDASSLLLACVVTGERVLAILPLVRSTGDDCRALSHRYSSFFTVLVDDGDREDVLACLAEGLNRLPCRSLLLEPVDSGDSRIDQLQRRMEEAQGFACQRHFRFYNWVLRVPGRSFAEYLAGRSTRLRQTIARKRRKLERERGAEIRLYAGDEVPAAMSGYHSVYRSSWKAHEQFEALLDGLVERCSERGWSRLAVLTVDGAPIAAQLWFVVGRKASIFRLAHDENWRRYSPGSILTAHLMEQVIDIDGVEEVDFLTGNEAYKQDWMSERRERWALSCVRPTQPRSLWERLLTSLRPALAPKDD